MSREALEAAKQVKEAASILYQHPIYLEDDIFCILNQEDDVYVASAATRTYQGDALLDVVSYHTSNAAVTVRMNQNGGQQQSSGDYAAGDILSGIEGVIGSQFSDTLYGNSQDM